MASPAVGCICTFMGRRLLLRNSLYRCMLAINCTINLIVGIAVIMNSVFYIRQHREDPVSRFLGHMVLYIAAYITIKIMPLFFVSLGRLIGDEQIYEIGMAISRLVWFPSNLIFFITRLCEPHIREYLKDYMKNLLPRLRVWFYSLRKEDADNLISSRRLLAIKIIDDRKLMKIEQIFIAVSIAHLNASSLSRASVNYESKRPRDKDETDNEVIKNSHLEVLEDSRISEECNIYLDSSIKIEYMRYGVQSYNRIMDRRTSEISPHMIETREVGSSQSSSNFSEVDCRAISK